TYIPVRAGRSAWPESGREAPGHPPPMPSQLEEYSASPALSCFAFGTSHSPEIEWKVVPFSMLPCVYPAQLRDWFAATTTMGRSVLDGADEGSRTARTKSHADRRTAARPQLACQGRPR